MKIGFLLDDGLDSTDGVQQYVKTLARWFTLKGHEVRFLVGKSSSNSEFGDKVISLSLNLKVRGNKNSLSMPIFPRLRRIKSVLKKEKFDILHVQMPYSPLMSQVVLAMSKAPRVGTFHIVGSTKFESTGSRILAAFQRKSLNSFSKILSVSQSAKEYSTKYFGLDSEILPNTIDLKVFENGTKLEKYNDGKFNIFYLGRLVERKGVSYLLKAYKELTSIINPDSVRLIIGGKGYLKAELEEFVAENDLKNVVFEGYISESAKKDYFATSDLCVFPSTEGESFGIVIIEAMAAGKLVLAGNNPGYASVLADKGRMLLVDPKDTEIFAQKLKVFREDKKFREDFINWEKEEVKKYSVEIVGQKLLEIYEEAASNN